MDKNSFHQAKQVWKARIAVFTILGMIAGLLCSRAVASISMILFGVNALWDVSPLRWLRQRWWLLGLGWIAMYAASYFWTANAGEWSAHLQVKMPFLLLPLAFGCLPPFTPPQLRAFTWGLLLIMCAGAAYSTNFLWHSPGNLIDSYKYAHVLPTPVYNDHIAFSSAVALTIAWTAFYLPAVPRGLQRLAVCGMALLLAVYLHVLAAKTGLAAFYILLAGVIIWHLKQLPKVGVALLLAAIIALGAAYRFLPTLRERAGYSMVTWRSYMMGERNGIYSDASRIISYDLALRSIATHPLRGVGAGDVLDEMRPAYARWYPQVPGEQQLWPHNQFLTCAMAAGIPAMLLFTAWILAPLRRVKRNRSGFYFVIIWLMLLVPLMVDPFLEVQAGVAVFLIFLLWQRKATSDAALRIAGNL